MTRGIIAGVMKPVLLALALAACGTPEPRPDPVGNRPAATTPLDAALDAPSTCVADCVRARQMVAMSIAAITAQCERDCALLGP